MPIKLVPHPAPRRARTRRLGSGGPVSARLDRARLESVTVLVVDDHRILADLLSGALTAAGMQPVGIATTAAQAVAMVRDLRPDIVVMDINMPRQDGLT